MKGKRLKENKEGGKGEEGEKRKKTCKHRATDLKLQVVTPLLSSEPHRRRSLTDSTAEELISMLQR